MGDDQQQGGTGIALAVLGGMLFMMTGFFYEQQKELINTIFLWFSIVELAPFTLISDLAAEAFGILREKTINPAQLEAEDLKKMLRFVGGYLAYPNAVLGVFLAYKAWTITPVEDLRSKYDLMTLLQTNAKVHPWMQPVANRNILDEPLLKGNWRIAMQPIEFAAHHGLLLCDGKVIEASELINMETGLADELSAFLADNAANSLDKEKCRRIFSEQIGPSFKDVAYLLNSLNSADQLDSPLLITGDRLNVQLIKELEDYKVGLIAAFMAMGCGDKDCARSLLNHMSQTFTEGRFVEKKSGILRKVKTVQVKEDIDIWTVPSGMAAHELIEKHATDQRLLRKSGQHATYVSTWMHFLLEFAREKGVLGTAEFIWLKPMNRTFFYTLQQAGGRAAWCEAAGPWAHYAEEQRAGVTLETPRVMAAVKAFEEALKETGWIAPK